MQKESPATECEKLAQALHELKKEILKTRFGRFMLWTLDKLSQMMKWIEVKIKKQ